MGLFSRTEHHDDGSKTTRDDDGTHSVTTNADGTIREESRVVSRGFPGLGEFTGYERVTRDGDGNIVNVQDMED